MGGVRGLTGASALGGSMENMQSLVGVGQGNSKSGDESCDDKHLHPKGGLKLPKNNVEGDDKHTKGGKMDD